MEYVFPPITSLALTPPLAVVVAVKYPALETLTPFVSEKRPV
jgi:hypothetical protein